MVKVLITGITGQDGSFLAKKLLKKNYKVYGCIRRGGSPKTQRLAELGIINDIEFITLELTEFSNVYDSIKNLRPDFIYNLAAQSYVKDSFIYPILTTQVNYLGTLNLLEAIRMNNLDTRFYQASTSEMYGNTIEKVQNEKSPFNPISPYAISKLASYFLVRNYRNAYNIHCSNGILFNHESEFRGTEFVTRKISIWLSQIKKDLWGPLPLGNLNSKRDWGYAPEYVDSMILINEAKQNTEYVVATNTQASVRDFLVWCCDCLDYKTEFVGKGINEKCINKKDGKIIAFVDPKYFRATDVGNLRGDYSLIEKELGWKPKTFAKEIAEKMIKYDLSHEWKSSLI